MNKTIHDTFLQICKSANSQICKLVHYRILFLILFPLGGLGGYAQPYEWDWAINGGSDNLDDNNWRYSTEQVYDVVVGSDNNYYRSEEHTSNSSHVRISYAVFCLKKKKKNNNKQT